MIFTVAMTLATVFTYAGPTLRFEDGKFRIMQLNDLHWKESRPDLSDPEEAGIRGWIRTQRPGLVVLNGDVVTSEPAWDSWRRIVGIMESEKVPFVVNMGNHDAEYVDKDELYGWLCASEWYAGEKGPEGIFGKGNCAITIAGEDGGPAAAVYCLDSNDYQPVKDLGEYDWIHFDQIEWFRDASSQLTAGNGGVPLPALAFFHIPLPEHKEIPVDDRMCGVKKENVCPPEVNSGMFLAMHEAGDVMGVFCAHDHDNDFVAMLRGMAVGYGRFSGSTAYASLEPGARVFDLTEGKREFDTFVVTSGGVQDEWHWPSGISGREEREMTYLPAVEDFTPHGQGVRYAYYEGPFKSTSEMLQCSPVEEGTKAGFDITSAPAEDHFGYVFDSMVEIPERGVYQFYLISDDGARLFIDGHEVVDNDGGHSWRRRDGRVALEKGFHRIRLPYFENYMGQQLEVGMLSRSMRESPIPETMLYLPPDDNKK